MSIMKGWSIPKGLPVLVSWLAPCADLRKKFPKPRKSRFARYPPSLRRLGTRQVELSASCWAFTEEHQPLQS